MPRKLLETFQVEYLQILDESGRADASLEPRLAAEELRELYAAMLLARQLDRRMYNLQQQGRIGTFPGVQGQEACVGVVAALRPEDWLVPAFRETAALFWRGVPIKNLLLYYMGLEAGNAFPEESKTLPIAITIGSQTLHATGLALAAKLRGDDVVSLVFFGDGATSEGDFHEACNMAGAFQAPVVFVCVNNQFAISLPAAQQTHARTLAQKAIAYGFPGIRLDGNDILAGYVATREAVERARSGQGPTLIECLTYRMGPHTTADDPRRYRGEHEVQEWQQRDPVHRFRKYLENRGLWTPQWQQELETEHQEQIEEAVRAAEAQRGEIEPLEMFDHVFAEPPGEVQAQKDEAAEALGERAEVRA